LVTIFGPICELQKSSLRDKSSNTSQGCNILADRAALAGEDPITRGELWKLQRRNMSSMKFGCTSAHHLCQFGSPRTTLQRSVWS